LGGIQRGEEEVTLRPRHGFQLEVVKPLLFNGDSEKIVVFVMAYKLYIRIRTREESVEEQVY